jgi:uncharacterized protein (DUF427 family)
MSMTETYAAVRPATAIGAVETKTSTGKEIRIPGADHPFTVSPADGRMRVTVTGRIVAESMRALRLEEGACYSWIYDYAEGCPTPQLLPRRSKPRIVCPGSGIRWTRF